ncbi:hypothetical protein [Halobaculum sp. P14]|uniref:hypothetical protein n=1 Tax=Halobaculum sp. P14 TaxID=3421638 RepID=UPI003EB757A4
MPPRTRIGAGGFEVKPGDFIGSNGIMIGKLVSTLLGALWLVFAAGWITLIRAIVRLHLVPINAAASLYAGIIRTLGGQASQTARLAWGEAFRAAVEASPILAPAIMSAEIIVVVLILAAARQRWGL